ncbi:MAG: YcxB family protein [Cyanobacteria bacterium P01_A01_bin.40]
MNETIVIKHLWKTENVVVGYKYYRQSKNSYRVTDLVYKISGTVFLVLGVCNLIFLLNLNFGSLFLIGSGIFLLLRNKINLLYFIHKCKQLKYENKQLEWEISEDKIVYRMLNLLETTLNWELIKGILDTPEGFLIFPHPNTYYWLPKSAFNNEADIAHFVFIAQDKVKNWQQIKSSQ